MRISPLGLQPRSDIASHIRWYISLRWLLLTAIIVPGLLSLAAEQGLSAEVLRDTRLGLVMFGMNVVFYGLARRWRHSMRQAAILAAVILFFDILIITFFIYTKGGIESRSIFFYFIPIIMAAALYGRSAVYVTALTAMACYNGLILADHVHLVSVIGELTPYLSNDSAFVLNSVVFTSSSILIVTVVVDFLAHLLQHDKEALQKSLAAFAQAQTIAHVGSWEYDLNAKTMHWSAELYRILGYKPDRDVPSCVALTAHMNEDDRRSFQQLCDEVASSQKPRRGNFRVDVGDDTHYLHAEMRPVVGHEGKSEWVIGTMHDVTDAWRLEEARNDFVSLASHQLRTPATVVKQYLHVLLDGMAGRLTPEQQSLAQKAFDGNERQLRIANDLMRVVQFESGRLKLKKSSADLAKLLPTVIADLRPQLSNRQQTIRYRCRRRSIMCRVDAERLWMALENIIENASKYSPEQAVIKVNLVQTVDEIRISVRDQGVGIAEDDIPKMFQKFARVQNRLSTQVGGSGLGMYLASKIIMLHKGRIDVLSKLGQGTTVDVVLPLRG